ncbi:MAG: hypothetical protein R2827_13800 [Bdellovibrionales bacterium]
MYQTIRKIKLPRKRGKLDDEINKTANQPQNQWGVVVPIESAHVSVILLGNTDHLAGFFESLEKNKIIVKRAYSVEQVRQIINGGEAAVIMTEDTEKSSPFNIAKKLQKITSEYNVPLVSVQKNFNQLKKFQKLYLSGVQFILKWPDEKSKVKNLFQNYLTLGH